MVLIRYAVGGLIAGLILAMLHEDIIAATLDEIEEQIEEE